MKIRLNIVDFQGQEICTQEEYELWYSISIKLGTLLYEIPYMPQVGWGIDISSFFENENAFTDQEKEFILDDYFYRVSDIYMHSTFIEVEISHKLNMERYGR